MAEHPTNEHGKGNMEQTIPPAEERGASRNEPEQKSGLKTWQVITSVLAAALGVQSSRNRERDFKQGKVGVFIVAGFIFTLLFILAVVGIVQLVVKGAGN